MVHLGRIGGHLLGGEAQHEALWQVVDEPVAPSVGPRTRARALFLGFPAETGIVKYSEEISYL